MFETLGLLAGFQRAAERHQRNRAETVGVERGAHLVADLDLASKLLANLSRKRLTIRLTGLDLAAREFPLAAEILVERPACAQNLAIAHNRRPHHGNRAGAYRFGKIYFYSAFERAS